ncbi:S8 family serine peptidase [Cupriavidus sp. 30B13]|uniref:S8 family serine peptidase n=1 Tax=Cupriavidus sp. 30B13 TaxID=3384241 RepID=UPI003B8F473D
MNEVAAKYVVRVRRRAEGMRGSGFWQSSAKPRDPLADALTAVTGSIEGMIPVERGALDSDVALVEVTEDQRAAIERTGSRVELYPLKAYSLIAGIDSALLASITASVPPAPLPPANTFQIKVTDQNGTPIAGAKVRLILPIGGSIHGITSALGDVAISAPVGFADCVVSTFSDFWAAFEPALYAANGLKTVTLQKLDAAFADCKKHHYPSVMSRGGRGVRVAVVDTGVDQHKDLPNVGKRTTVVASPPYNLVNDNGIGHGTHVAGIIGANGVVCGVAPNAQLLSYRVFEQDSGKTDNYLLIQAVLAAMQDGADIINLSVGDVDSDPGLESAVEDAAAAGVLVVAASGNFGQPQVCHPAAHPKVVSVGAVGRANTFPAGTIHAWLSRRAHGTDPDDFVPAFSNFGKVDLAAPGVGIVSTIGTDGYAALDGTSMATPVISGVAACLLSDEPTLTGKPRTPERLAELLKLLYAKCDALGFAKQDVGVGLPK